jgi:serine/threonine protein kinase
MASSEYALISIMSWATEVLKGSELGRGEFGVVSEVTGLCLNKRCNCEGLVPLGDLMAPPEPPVKTVLVLAKPQHVRSSSVTFAEDTKGPKSVDTVGTNDNTETETAMSANVSEYDGHSCCDDDDCGDGINDAAVDEEELLLAKNNTRISMSANTHRDGTARYAIKRLKRGMNRKVRLDAAIDLACEALFLRYISHTNIIHLRGTVGIPGTPDFAILLDRLVQTLDSKFQEWQALQKLYRGKLFGLVDRRKQEIDNLLTERLLVSFDIARALRHLANRRILYRDLKPDNIGFNVRGTSRLLFRQAFKVRLD